MIKVQLNCALTGYEAPECKSVRISIVNVLCGSPVFGSSGEAGGILEEDDEHTITL